ncbi:hypothetical protein BDW02DRAFT_600521 [Decorospora gaudefroyi]|uniref:Uncharacterized protein n=1 Tax=Decorospora gaudefroyi TaxID=184978 RepID=A0A6A5K5A5_9PLEO|nr:hypothetical protein BDW02DRAFT_600521 [Decorospora gaudefroyi]
MTSLEKPCHLTKLSTELILLIADHVPLEHHLDFACTCKRIALGLANVLQRHREAHEKYKVASDLSPYTVVNLLRSAFGYGDPIPAWHVRSFELWYDRKSWSEWKMLDFQNHPADDSAVAYEPADLMRYGDLETYLEPLEHGDSTGEDAEAARVQMEEGQDAPLKAVLIATLPRLLDVKFVPHPIDCLFEEQPSTLGWLQTLILEQIKSSDWARTPGLHNLQSVSIGVLARLMRLPNIDSIYMRNFSGYASGMRSSECDIDYLPSRSSNLKHLWLDNPDLLDYHDQGLSEAAEALLTVSLRAGNEELQGVKSFVNLLGENSGETIQSLMSYDYETTHRSRHSRASFDLTEFSDYEALQHLSLDVADVTGMLSEVLKEPFIQRKDESDHEFNLRYFVNALPETIETLTLWTYVKGMGRWRREPEVGDSELEELEKILVALMQSGRCSNLKAIYLERIDRDAYRSSHRKIHFQEAVRVGRTLGIDVHTLTNRRKAIHDIEWREAPDKYDLKTGPWGARPADWVFSPYTGRRESPGCRKCGKCEVCLTHYTKELWESVEAE